MKPTRRQYRRPARSKPRGAALVGALAFAVVIAFIIAGLGVFSMSHYSRATTEANYAAALNLAEAGINYEIRNVSDNSTSTVVSGTTQYYPYTISGTTYYYPDQPSSYTSGGSTITNTGCAPATGSVGSIRGSYTCWVTPVGSTDGTENNLGPWQAPNPVMVWSTGSYQGAYATVSREVYVTGASNSIFNQYALYGIVSSTFSGNYIIDGTYGSNASVTNSGNSSEVYGNVVFNGYSSGTYSGNIGWIQPSGPTGQILHNPDTINWPTVSQIADAAASTKSGSSQAGNGLNWFKSNNNNASIQVFTAADANNTTDPTTRATTAIAVSQIQATQGQKTYWVLPKNVGSADSNPMDAASATTPRYVFPATTFSYVHPTNSVSLAAIGLKANNVIILPGAYASAYNYANPPANPTYMDYYFENIDMSTSGNQTVLVDTAHGPIRIWLNASDNTYSTNNDTLGTFIFTSSTTAPIVTASTNPAGFRLYDNKGVSQGGGSKGFLGISGGTYFPGGIYAYNGTAYSAVQFSGGSVIYGSVIASTVGGNGNPLIKFPNNGNSSAGDFSLFYSFKDNWTELNGAN